MKTYVIKASVTTGIEVEVEATNEAEALKKAKSQFKDIKCEFI